MSSPTRHPSYRWAVLAMATLAVFGALGLGRFGYTAILPSMQDGLALTNTQTGALATANLVGYLALALVGGALASRYGPRIVVTAGLLTAGAGMVFTGFAGGFSMAATTRAFTGFGSAAANVPAMAMLAAWFSMKRRGLAAGVAVAGSSIGLIITGPLVPRLVTAYGDAGWRVSWFVFGASAVALGVLAWVVLRDRPASLSGGEHVAGDRPAAARRPVGFREWRSVYSSGRAWHLGLIYFTFGCSYMIYMTFFTKRLVTEGGYTPENAGELFMVMGWASMFCGVIWGWVSDAIGRRGALVGVFALHAVSFSIFALWPEPAGFTVSAVLYGLTAWSIPAIMMAACGDAFGSAMAPAALGFITLFHGLGQAVGPSVAGAMADAYLSFGPAYLLAAAVALLGAIGALTLRRSRRGAA